MGKQLSKREVGFFIVTVVLFVVYFGNNIMLEPVRQEISGIEQRIADTHDELRKKRRIINKAKAIESRYKNLIDQYAQGQPNEEIMTAMISEIEKVASQLELTISDMKPQKKPIEGLYNQFLVSLRIESGLEDTVHFLYILQSQQHNFDVENIRFDMGRRKKTDTMKTTLVLSKFFIP